MTRLVSILCLGASLAWLARAQTMTWTNLPPAVSNGQFVASIAVSGASLTNFTAIFLTATCIGGPWQTNNGAISFSGTLSGSISTAQANFAMWQLLGNTDLCSNAGTQ
jgi:hypothetical protein